MIGLEVHTGVKHIVQLLPLEALKNGTSSMTNISSRTLLNTDKAWGSYYAHLIFSKQINVNVLIPIFNVIPLPFRYGLACSKEAWIINRYLDRTLNTEIIRIQDRSSTLSYIGQIAYNKYITWSWAVTNWDKIMDRYLITQLMSNYNSNIIVIFQNLRGGYTPDIFFSIFCVHMPVTCAYGMLGS